MEFMEMNVGQFRQDMSEIHQWKPPGTTTEQTSSKTLTFKVHQTAKNAFSPLEIAADFFFPSYSDKFFVESASYVLRSNT